ncbi:hypothetical protein F4778DRAFT_669301 [Xylariomycetidae sp. FL2044]|nr:hypothetical protein F4778DRAFT_669301 [Xylariomycetidae sp. FL2044]
MGTMGQDIVLGRGLPGRLVCAVGHRLHGLKSKKSQRGPIPSCEAKSCKPKDELKNEAGTDEDVKTNKSNNDKLAQHESRHVHASGLVASRGQDRPTSEISYSSSNSIGLASDASDRSPYPVPSVFDKDDIQVPILQPRAPAPPTQSQLNRKHNTFPLTKDKEKIETRNLRRRGPPTSLQSLNAMVNDHSAWTEEPESLDQAVNKISMEEHQRRIPATEDTPAAPLQPVPDDFKHNDQTQLRDLNKRFSPEMMRIQMQVSQLQQKQAGPNAAYNSGQFVKIWEIELLPWLEDILDDHVQGQYSVNVRRSKEPGHRIIDIMTATEVPEKVKGLIEEKKTALLKPANLHDKTSIETRLGMIQFLSDDGDSSSTHAECGSPRSPTLSQSSEDSYVSPRNNRRYSNPVMGDSVGPEWRGQYGGSATIGPTLQIQDDRLDSHFYRLLNWHTFYDRGKAYKCEDPSPPKLRAYHPSKEDWPDNHVMLGETVAYSGLMHKTCRSSNSIHRAAPYLGRVPVVTDWVLVEDLTEPRVNRVRRMHPDQSFSSEKEVTAMSDPRGGNLSESTTNDPIEHTNGILQAVYSTGRTSGYNVGQICETLGTFKFENKTKTREWAIESEPRELESDWIRGGMGVPGDSGAPVIDLNTNKLLGQIWGRNRYAGHPTEPRLTFFTAMSDILDDIEERTGWARPTLPTEESIAASQTRRSSSPATTATTSTMPIPIRTTASETHVDSNTAYGLPLASIDEDGNGDDKGDDHDGDQDASTPNSLYAEPPSPRTPRRSTAAAAPVLSASSAPSPPAPAPAPAPPRATGKSSSLLKYSRLTIPTDVPGCGPAHSWKIIFHAATF